MCRADVLCDCEELYLMALPGTSPKRRIKSEETERRASEAKRSGPSIRVAASSGVALCCTGSSDTSGKRKVDFLPTEKVITEEKRFKLVYTVSHSKNCNKVLTKFCFPTHILPQVTLETVPLKLVG